MIGKKGAGLSPPPIVLAAIFSGRCKALIGDGVSILQPHPAALLGAEEIAGSVGQALQDHAFE